MIRVTTWRQNVPPPPDAPPATGLAAFQELIAALKKVPGAGDIQWGFGHGGIVTVGFPESYAVADAILKDPGVQTAAAKVLSLGIGIVEDFFVATPEQIAPFLQQAQQR